MKRALLSALCLAALTGSAWAQTGPIYSTIPDGCQVRPDRPGSEAGPLYDSRGFYEGYYRPLPPVQPITYSQSIPQQPEPSISDSSAYDNSGGGGGYGYGGYYGYGRSNYSQTVSNPLGTTPGSVNFNGAGLPYSPTLPNYKTPTTSTTTAARSGGGFSRGSSGGSNSGSGGHNH